MTENEESGVGAAPPETVKLCVEAVKSMGPDELESFERQTFRTWSRDSLGDLRRAIQQRRREFDR
jgi:hypothetical protein